MSSGKKYIRKFIILQGIETTYTKAKGHAKLEIRDGKGKLTVNVEGLTHITATEKVCKVSLLAKDTNKIIKEEVGIFEIGEKGREKKEIKFYPSKLETSGLTLDDFNGVVVELATLNHSDSTPLLIGYIDEDETTIAGMINKPIEKVETIAKVEVNEKEVNDDIQDEYIEGHSDIQEEENLDEDESTDSDNVEEIECRQEAREDIKDQEKTLDVDYEIDEEDLETEDKYYEDVDEDNENIHQDFPNKEFIKVEREDDFFVDEDDLNEKIQKHQDFQEYDIGNISGNDGHNGHGYSLSQNSHDTRSKIYDAQIANYTMNILKFFQKVEPFEEDLQGYTWWEIEYDEKNVYRGFLPYYNHIISMYYPYPSLYKTVSCQSLIKKYDHYIFGIVEEDNEIKYYVYGIPGQFTRREQPYRGSTGFTTWLKRRGNENEGLGYWLLHINPSTGKVDSPLRNIRQK